MNTPAHIFKCKHCGAKLGVATANVLIVGPVKYTRSTRLPCAKCSRSTLWSVTRATNNLRAAA